MNIYILFLLTLFNLSSSTNYKHKLHLQADCKIFDTDGGLLRKYDSYLCLFMDDGSYFSLVGSRENVTGFISRRGQNNRIIWKIKEDVHHELSLTSDKKRLTYLSSEGAELNGEKIRFDVLNIVDLEGRRIARYSFKDHFSEFKKILTQQGKHLAPVQVVPSGVYKNFTEYTHFNSFKEIPQNALSNKVPWLRAGNFILGGNCTNLFFIFNSTLTKIEKIINYEDGKLCGTHDAQVLPTGNILHYVNIKVANHKQSYLEEYNPLLEKVVWSWPKEKNQFYNFMLGSVQRLDNGETIFTDEVAVMKGSEGIKGSKPYIVKLSVEGLINKKWRMSLVPNKELYRARLMPLEAFLKNSF